MRRIGIVGGLSPESTLDYYRTLVSLNRERGFGHSYPVIIIYSVSFQECVDLMNGVDWSGMAAIMNQAVSALHGAGADFGLISANTPHMVFDEVAAKAPIPLLSIVEATGTACQRLGLKKIGLFGTRITMQADFYPKIFEEKFGLAVVMPGKDEPDFIHDSIAKELIEGQIRAETRERLVRIAEEMVEKDGIEGLILGCTELPLILSEKDFTLPVLDTTRIHVEAAFEYALAE
ncbi:MAG: amino acid racemase [Gemmatimonadota bacterium]|nr:MAG: amino acid racemase [Gemmatimonadota bacterium]